MSTPRIIKSKLIPVYKEPGKTNIAFTRHKAGTYLIYEDKQLVYVGYSSYDLYKTCIRHFQRWSAASQFMTFLGFTSGVTYFGNDMARYKVRFVICSPDRAERLEKMLIRKYQPRDNTEKYKDYEPKPYDIGLVDEFTKAKVTPIDDDEVPF